MKADTASFYCEDCEATLYITVVTFMEDGGIVLTGHCSVGCCDEEQRVVFTTMEIRIIAKGGENYEA